MDQMTPIDITFDQAVALLKEPKRRRGQAAKKEIKALGKHPVTEREIKVLDGRFGPYVTDGEINASVTKGMDPQSLTMDDAVNLLEARAAKLGNQAPKKKKAPAKKKKAATKKKK